MERLIQCISFLYKRITIFLWKRRHVDKFRKTIVTYSGKEKNKKISYTVEKLKWNEYWVNFKILINFPNSIVSYFDAFTFDDNPINGY